MGQLFRFGLSPSTRPATTLSLASLLCQMLSLATSLSYSGARGDSQHLGTEVQMPRPGIRGPPGPRRAPQVDSWWRSEPVLHLLSTTTPQGPWCHYLQGPSGGSAHGGPAQQQGDRNREVKALVQGHTARKWQSRDLNRQSRDLNWQGLYSRPCPHLGLLRFPKGSWAGQGVGETLVPTSQTKRTFWNFWKSEKKKNP